MGLLQEACITYDAHEDLIGREIEGKEALAPISHIIQKANLEITIDNDGNFKNVTKVDEADSKTIIPATEESANRSGTCASQRPHPLCDGLKYIVGNSDRNNYLENLENWVNSDYTHDMASAIFKYVSKKSILKDLENSGIFKLTDEGNLPENYANSLIRWNVVGLGLDYKIACWKEPTLMKAFVKYYGSIRTSESDICMVSGGEVPVAEGYPKGIVDKNYNAKLISANDKNNFTFRGRFFEEREAATIGYEAIQKANNALHWLVKNQGTIFGNRTFICWNPQGVKIPVVTGPIVRKSKENSIITPSDYKRELDLTIMGYKNKLPSSTSKVIVAAFDAAIQGRLSTTYYSELIGSDFLERLKNWDEHCCWYKNSFGVESPSMFDIVNCAFGDQYKENDRISLRTDEKIRGQQIQRLLRCRVDGCKIPTDIEKILVNKVSSLKLDDKKSFFRDNFLFIACAVIKKYYFDYFKKELSMSLEPQNSNRSYQFGRLLAVLEKAERDTFDEDEKREPNAIRLQSVFCKKPMHIFRIIQEQLKKGYYPKLKPSSRAYYDKIISEIIEIISNEPEEEQNRPLEDLYLMGYYLQRKELYTSKVKSQEEN